MKKYLLGIILSLFLYGNTFAAIGYVGGSTIVNENGGGLTCTATYTTTPGNTVVGFILINSTTISAVTITGSGGVALSQRAIINSTRTLELWSTTVGASDNSTSFVFTISGTGPNMRCGVLEYSGVQAFGITGTNSGTSTDPTIDLITQDANNYVVVALWKNNANVMSAVTGNQRETQSTGLNTTSEYDNTAASATTVTNTGTSTISNFWTAVALELRSVASSTIVNTRGLLGVGQ